MCNIQNEDNVRDAIQQAVNKFGGIDILVNSASAIHIEPSENISMKRYDLMHSINGRGTFLVSKYAIPYLKKSSNGHIITMAPPIQTVDQPHWFRQAGTAYTSAKLQMSLQVIGLSAELCGNHLPNSTHVGVNGLWPRTTIATAAIQNILGDDNMMRRSRSAEIMADAAYAIMCSDNKRNTGNFWIDDEVMVGTGLCWFILLLSYLSVGAVDLSKYRIDPNLAEHELCPDLFV